MSLSFGWHMDEVRHTTWPGDPAYVDVPDDVIAQWRDDMDPAHLLPYAKAGKPSAITVRTLTHREVMRARSLMTGGDVEAMFDVLAYLFRVGVDFPDLPEKFTDASGAEHQKHTHERGVRALSDAFARQVDRAYPGIVEHFGSFLLRSQMLTSAEKKASSPSPTGPPSSAVEAAAGSTASPG